LYLSHLEYELTYKTHYWRKGRREDRRNGRTRMKM